MLALLLFLIYINNLKKTENSNCVHHLKEDTNFKHVNINSAEIELIMNKELQIKNNNNIQIFKENARFLF